MDKDRIKGAAHQAKGGIKSAVGKALGDQKLQVEGEAEKAKGRVESAVGGLKDTLRGNRRLWSFANDSDMDANVPSAKEWRAADELRAKNLR